MRFDGWDLWGPHLCYKNLRKKTHDGSRFKKQDVVTNFGGSLYNYVLYTDYLDVARWFYHLTHWVSWTEGKTSDMRPQWIAILLYHSSISTGLNYEYLVYLYISTSFYKASNLKMSIQEAKILLWAALANLELINHLALTKTTPPPRQAYKIHRENCRQETLLYQRRKIWETPGALRHRGHHPSWLEGLSLMLAARSSFCVFLLKNWDLLRQR